MYPVTEFPDKDGRGIFSLHGKEGPLQNPVGFAKGLGKAVQGPLFHLNLRLLFQNLIF
jgi:hypothetical protein